MAKRSSSRKEPSHPPPSLQPFQNFRPSRKVPTDVLAAGIGLVVYVLLMYLALPRELPALLQRILGLGCATLAAWLFSMATRDTLNLDEQLFERVRHGQHADFGKELRHAYSRRRRVRLPIVGAVPVRPWGSALVFLLVGGWWLTPWAPIRVKEQALEDLTVSLGEEIAAVVTVWPETEIALARPPIPPLRARQAADLIPDRASPYLRGLKAIAAGQFDTARALLRTAAKDHEVKPLQLLLARAQNEMYDGRFPEAEALYADALKLDAAHPPLVAQAAVAALQAGDYAKAEELNRQLKRLCDDKKLAADPAQAVYLHLEALLCVNRGEKLQAAEDMCYESRGIVEKALGSEQPFALTLMAASQNNQATLYLLRAKYPSADELFKAAEDKWDRPQGPPDSRMSACLVNLAALEGHQGQYSDAANHLQQAVKIDRQTLPKEHPIRAVALAASAQILARRARTDEAQTMIAEALRLAEKSLGSLHPLLAPILDTQGVIFVDQARYVRAEPMLLRAQEIAKRAWGAKHPYLAVIQNHLAGLYIIQGRYDLAEQLSNQAIENVKRALGEKHPSLATLLVTRGRVEIARGEPRNSRSYLEQALKLQQKALGNEHPDVARTTGYLAGLENSPRTYAGGVAQYKRAIDLEQQLLGQDHPEVARMLVGLAALHAEMGHPVDATVCLDNARLIQEKSLAADHPELAATLEAYATSLLASDPAQTERAKELQKRAKEIRDKHTEADREE